MADFPSLPTTLDPPRMGGNLMSKLCPPWPPNTLGPGVSTPVAQSALRRMDPGSKLRAM